jgi:hypothetical protein
MQRRQFIRNTGLSAAALSIGNALWASNHQSKIKLKVVVLMSGGVAYHDIFPTGEAESAILFREAIPAEIICKTNMQYNGHELEHQTALLYALQALQSNDGKIIFIGNASSPITQKLMQSNHHIEVIATTSSSEIMPYRNDAAVFQKAQELMKPLSNLTLILNLDDTDVAHYNSSLYFEVLDFYKKKLNALGHQLFQKDNHDNYEIAMIAGSVLGRNDAEFIRQTDEGVVHHHEQSSKKLFCFILKPSKQTALHFDHDFCDSKQLMSDTLIRLSHV